MGRACLWRHRKWCTIVAAPFAEGMGRTVQGSLESSNVNVVQELVDMIETQRAYEVSSKPSHL